ncbi:MAG: ExeM/NucH family extracellular endonuclease, partial [Arenimonas sp.]|uniref:ExeM/NucH family extracellular endonuclease n=1 Tax=Arenimonas sp. TaxID=1872635 RepID=UPI0025C6D809
MRRCLLIASSLWLAGCDAPRPDAPLATPDAGLLTIAQVQGSGARSPLEGRQVTVEGVVVANFAQGLGGVFVQSQADDGDPATGEGLFLPRRPDAEPRLRLGDLVRATGEVVERGEGDQTLTSLQAQMVEVLGRGDVTPRVLSEVPAAGWESVEGELLSITAPLTVTGNDGLARFGELFTSFGGRLYAPTEVAPPGAEAQAVARENERLSLRLDDARSGQDPKALWFLPGAWNDTAPLRAGSVITGVQGVLDQRFGSHRLQLTEKFAAIEQAPRPEAPTVPGDRRIAGFNVLNLFNGDGQGGGFPTDRGAATPADHARQVAKLVTAMQALDPDLAALMELENDGFGPESSLAQFVAALNAAGPHADWRFVDAGEGPGTNAIRVGIIYRSSRFKTVGKPASIAEGPFERASRAPLAQAFRAGSGPVFVVVANHFKSKGGCDKATGGDADSGDGQACYNATRVASARQLNEWLATDPTGTSPEGTLVLGDLNAHAQEDPLRLLYSRGWRDAFALAKADRPYSFVWAGRSARLDHALLDLGLAGRLRGATEWHANADESTHFDY